MAINFEELNDLLLRNRGNRNEVIVSKNFSLDLYYGNFNKPKGLFMFSQKGESVVGMPEDLMDCSMAVYYENLNLWVLVNDGVLNSNILNMMEWMVNLSLLAFTDLKVKIMKQKIKPQFVPFIDMAFVPAFFLPTRREFESIGGYRKDFEEFSEKVQQCIEMGRKAFLSKIGDLGVPAKIEQYSISKNAETPDLLLFVPKGALIDKNITMTKTYKGMRDFCKQEVLSEAKDKALQIELIHGGEEVERSMLMSESRADGLADMEG